MVLSEYTPLELKRHKKQSNDQWRLLNELKTIGLQQHITVFNFISFLFQFRNLTKEMRMYAQKFIDKGKDFVLELAIKTRLILLLQEWYRICFLTEEKTFPPQHSRMSMPST